MDKTVITTIKVVLTVLAMSLAIIVVYRLANVFAILLIALFVVLSVEPAVKFFMRQTLFNKPVPRSLAVIMTYVALIVVVLFIFTLGLPPVLSQTQKLVQNAGKMVANIPLFRDMNISLDDLAPQFKEISNELLDKTASVVSGFTATITILILAIYISIDWSNLKENFYKLFSGRAKNTIIDTVTEIESDLGQWVKGQLTLMLFVGVLSFFALLVLGIDYPLALGLLAGLLEIIPLIGPLISWAIAGLIGFSISPTTGILALIIFLGIQQLENSFLVPKVMAKVSGFSPLIVLLAILVAGSFFGAIGAIVAVPITMIGVVIVRRVLNFTNK